MLAASQFEIGSRAWDAYVLIFPTFPSRPRRVALPRRVVANAPRHCGYHFHRAIEGQPGWVGSQPRPAEKPMGRRAFAAKETHVCAGPFGRLTHSQYRTFRGKEVSGFRAVNAPPQNDGRCRDPPAYVWCVKKTSGLTSGMRPQSWPAPFPTLPGAPEATTGPRLSSPKGGEARMTVWPGDGVTRR